MTSTYILIAVAVLALLVVAGIYNGLIAARMRVKEAWADIDIQLKRRFELIPNLVETVKGSTSFESETLEKVIAARTRGMKAHSPAEVGQADVAMKSALSGFFALAESYPDLKSNQNFISLQEELSDTENKIQSARRFYNGVVSENNTKVQTFPTNIFARIFSFKEAEFFELTDGDSEAKNPVKVKF